MIQDTAVERIPVEIWREVFDSLALSHPKGEFNLEGEAYVFVDKSLGQPPGILDQVEEDKAIKDRLAVVLVCRRWYSIGVQALWRHLWINMDKGSKCGIEGVCKAIERDGDLATFVTRLTVQSRRAAIMTKLAQQESIRFIPYLVSLRIIVCPRLYAVDLRIPSLDVVVLRGPDFPVYPRRIDTEEFMFLNVKTLRINLSEWYRVSSDWEDIHFPRLENLNILVIDELTTLYVTQHWNLPKLRIFSITAHNTPLWLNFIQKWSGELHTLEIVFGDGIWPRSINLPALKKFIFCGRRIGRWSIQAPELEHFAIFDLDPNMFSDVGRAINAVIIRARQMFPALHYIRLYARSGTSFLTPVNPKGLTEEDIDDLRRWGFQVDIQS